MSAGNSIQAMPMITVDTSTLSNITYTEVTSGGLPHAISFFRFISIGVQDILLSYDGITEHDVITGRTIYAITSQQIATPNNFVSAFPKGTKIYLKAVIPTFLNLYIVGYYQK